MEEIWKDVVGYEGLYQVSNLGRVRSVKKEIWLGHGKGFIKTFPEQIITQHRNNGYWYVSLSKDSKKQQKSVHRLVAEAFIPNPDPEHKTQVGHKDEKNFKTSNECNNNVENLEWVTAQENCAMPEWKERTSGENSGFYGRHHSEETKQKLRELNVGKEGYWRTHKISLEMRENMSKNHADVTGEKNPMYGRTHTKEARERISKLNGKKVYCDGIVFNTCKECAKYFNICYQTLSKVLTGMVSIPKTWCIKTVYYLDNEQN